MNASAALPINMAKTSTRLRSFADATRFLLAQGHEIPAIEVVVDADDDHVVVEKVGRAGDLAQRLDPRAA